MFFVSIPHERVKAERYNFETAMKARGYEDKLVIDAVETAANGLPTYQDKIIDAAWFGWLLKASDI